MISPPVVLTIAGSDSGAGAGIQADLKTFFAHGVFGTTAITAVTAQNTLGVQARYPVSATLLAAQIESVCSDFSVRAVKVGMLCDAEQIRTVARRLPNAPVVLDPVLRATAGQALLRDGDHVVLRDELFACADVVTPNLLELAMMLDEPLDTYVHCDAERRIDGLQKLAACADGKLGWILLKGGHAEDNQSNDCVDLLFNVQTKVTTWVAAPRMQATHTHGTGCTYASALAANLALGLEMLPAVLHARSYVQRAIAAAQNLSLGKGHGPLEHNVPVGILTELRHGDAPTAQR